MNGKEQRRVRFASIAGISREDLPLAAEIWYEDIIRQIWSSRDVIKVALVLTRYMSAPRDELLSVGYIERSFNLDVQQTLDTMRQLQMFGAVEAFSINDNVLHASLCLSLVQRVKTMEMRARIIELSGAGTIEAFLKCDAADHWTPPEPVKEETNEPKPHRCAMDLVKTLERKPSPECA